MQPELILSATASREEARALWPPAVPPSLAENYQTAAKGRDESQLETASSHSNSKLSKVVLIYCLVLFIPAENFSRQYTMSVSTLAI